MRGPAAQCELSGVVAAATNVGPRIQRRKLPVVERLRRLNAIDARKESLIVNSLAGDHLTRYLDVRNL